MIWLECVPNVSEGRDAAWIDSIAELVACHEQVHLLDYSSDPDHDRSVFTLAGRPDPLIEVILDLASAAVERIDLRVQEGVHPRVGALDVVPFVPLGDAPTHAAIAAAHAVGERVAAELGVPVFAYAQAARRPERRRLEEIRRGGLAGLTRRMEDPDGGCDWAPDWGPPSPHRTAGATVVGARDLLLAFNVLLDTDDVGVAREIARAVRESSGGLPTVKAMGVPLRARGVAQVSLNLTDFTVVPPLVAFERVRLEARRRGAEVIASERIGLFPRAALEGVTPAALLLENPDPAGSLDDRLLTAGIRL